LTDRPNVLIFCVDEMRADHMACAGNLIVRTPNLDRIAAAGTTFARAYCNNPLCMPARASLFTSLLPRDHGVRVNGQGLRTDLPTLPGVLAAAGWRTHAAGKLHLTPWVPNVHPPDPRRFCECMAYWNDGLIEAFPTPYYGFQSVDFVGGHTAYAYGPYLRWLEQRGGDRSLLGAAGAGGGPPRPGGECYRMAMPEALHYNRFIADSAIRVIEEGDADGGRPFFIWCSFPDPHAPVAPPEPYAGMYDPRDIPPPAGREGEADRLPAVYRHVLAGDLCPNGCDSSRYTPRRWQQIIAMTYGMITHVDAEVGRVLDALRRAGQAERTIVIFVSDHGDMMGDHGLAWKAFYTFRGCIAIPLIVSAPPLPAGRTTDALAAQIDLMPTVLDLCGVAMPGADWAQADTPFQRGSVLPLRPHPGRSLRPVLDGSAAAVRDEVVIENDDPTCGFRVRTLVTQEHRLSVYPGTADGELFDLRADGEELCNLWYDADRSALRARLTARLLDAYSRQTPLHPIPAWNA
jgi:arylsulfatase A-like enzyme